MRIVNTQETTPKRSSRRGPTEPRGPDEALSSLPPSAVQKMAESVAGARNAADAIKDHLAITQDLSRARLVFVSLFEADKGALAVSGARGRADDSVVAVKPGEGAIGKAFAERASVETEDGHLALPLLDGAAPLGVLSVVGARQKATPEVWQALASHLVATMQVAQLRDAAVRRTRDLETAVAGLKSLEKAREELLGNVSHELKSPLTTIKAYLAMGQKNRLGELSDKQKRAFEVCERNADRLLRLINDMLLTSRLQTGRMELDSRPFGLRALVQEALGPLAPLAASSKVEVSLEKTSEVYVKGDRERMLEAMVHLLENSIVYNRSGGVVSLEITAVSGVAVLKVQDNGPGIHPDDLPHVFERFFRGREAGSHSGRSGLGLSLVRQIVQLHAGSVAVESELGSGTTFTVRLPLFAGAVSEGARVAEPQDGAILLVEDDRDCREVLTQVLESEGLRVVALGDRESALQFLQAARPALVLLDLRLGTSDGRAVLQHIRADERLASTPVFVVSGAADSAAGFRYDGPEHIDGFFEKPLNLPRLLDRIQEIVRPDAQASGGI